MPWMTKYLRWWRIVGMNHYDVNGASRLFVAMTWNSFCIKAEGRDEQALWDNLSDQARVIMEKHAV
jgi:hypothetical protein